MKKIVEVKDGCIFAYIGAHQNLTKGETGVETEHRVLRFYLDDVEEKNLTITKIDGNNTKIGMFFEAGVDSQGNEYPATTMEFLVRQSNGKIQYFVSKVQADDVPNANKIVLLDENDKKANILFITRDKDNIELDVSDEFIDEIFSKDDKESE